MSESGIYVVEAVELPSGQVIPTAAMIVNAEKSYVVHSRMMFPPRLAIQYLADGVATTDVMLDFCLN
jgi:hypothetical protein